MNNNLLAQGIVNPLLNVSPGTPGSVYITDLITKLVTLGYIAGAVIFFFMLITGAIQWISSGGDKASVENARGKITSALVGLAVLFSVYAILAALKTFFGVDITILDLTTLKIQ